ncbi:hypothetical protein CERSUDRAFT_126373 [Gelatoporia subvermispora B]|uniref:Uncharacterized protein n=1 Tax=Ceriporiopsis subvermispora (strain B) TaxID=914234 RepID=M2R2X4_CERS8|nr:hypothetical protein CERSUDRAFT_126373 [Gelatoporia subvermispora B]
MMMMEPRSSRPSWSTPISARRVAELESHLCSPVPSRYCLPRPILIMSSPYFPHVLYSLAIISLGMHTLRQRKDAEAARDGCEARISVLSDLATRLRARERVPEEEFKRMWRLSRPREELEAALPGSREEKEIGWREVLFGRKVGGEGEQQAKEMSERQEEWDRKDWEQGVSVKAEVTTNEGVIRQGTDEGKERGTWIRGRTRAEGSLQTGRM